MHGFHVVQNLKLVLTDIEERGAAEFLDPLSLMMRISRSLILKARIFSKLENAKAKKKNHALVKCGTQSHLVYSGKSFSKIP